MFDTDARHPLIYMYETPIQKEEYQSAVDELAGTPVEALTFSLGDTRSLLHNTKVGGRWGDGIDRWPHLIWKRARQNADRLIAEGNDPLRVICDRGRELGVLIYPSLFVQQGGRERAIKSWVDEEVGTAFTRTAGAGLVMEMTPLHIGAAGDLADDPAANCYDFKHQEVRDERSAVIEETLANYEVDGFELHLSYAPHYFHPREVEAGRATMTEWIGSVYNTVKASGPDRELVVRIPAGIDGCLSAGLDPVEWVRRGIVDVIAAEHVIGAERNGLVDPMTDFRPLVEAAKGSPCRVLAGLHAVVMSDRQGEASIEVVRAAACNYWAQGVDGLYLMEWWLSWPYDSRFYEKLREVPYPEVMAPKDKYYVIPNRSGGRAYAGGQATQLPAGLQVGTPASFDLTISDDLPHWDEMGRVLEVLLRFRLTGNTELDRVGFKLNGKDLPSNSMRKINELYRMKGPNKGGGGGSGYWYIFRLERDDWPVTGGNTLEVTLLERDPGVLPSVSVHFVELEVRYLMGRSFHRGLVDPDLGPYVSTSKGF